MKDKKPVELHNYTIKIYEFEGAEIFEVSVEIPRLTLRFLKSLLELIEKYGRR